MLKAFATLSAAVVLLAAVQPAWAQPCPGCGRTGPHSMHPRGHVFHGGELTPLPPAPRKDEEQPARMTPPAVAARKVSQSKSEPMPTVEEHDPLANPPAQAKSARRQIPQEAPRDSIGDPFSLVPPLKPKTPAPQPNLAPPADHGDQHGTGEPGQEDEVGHERPRFYYSGSQFPYYYGRSFVSYPHYDGWHETTTNMHKNARKNRKHSWWTMPVGPSEEWMQTTQHGLEPEQGPEMAAPRPGAAARRVLSGLWQR